MDEILKYTHNHMRKPDHIGTNIGTTDTSRPNSKNGAARISFFIMISNS